MQKIYESRFHGIKLIITGTDEPNNGRELWVADIYINGINQTEKFFGSWNWLNWNLDNYVMDSPDGKYVFIPAEGGGFLIDISTLERIDLPYNALSTIKFLKNEFVQDALILTYSDETIEINLNTLNSKRI